MSALERNFFQHSPDYITSGETHEAEIPSWEITFLARAIKLNEDFLEENAENVKRLLSAAVDYEISLGSVLAPSPDMRNLVQYGKEVASTQRKFGFISQCLTGEINIEAQVDELDSIRKKGSSKGIIDNKVKELVSLKRHEREAEETIRTLLIGDPDPGSLHGKAIGDLQRLLLPHLSPSTNATHAKILRTYRQFEAKPSADNLLIISFPISHDIKKSLNNARHINNGGMPNFFYVSQLLNSPDNLELPHLQEFTRIGKSDVAQVNFVYERLQANSLPFPKKLEYSSENNPYLLTYDSRLAVDKIPKQHIPPHTSDEDDDTIYGLNIDESQERKHEGLTEIHNRFNLLIEQSQVTETCKTYMRNLFDQLYIDGIGPIFFTNSGVRNEAEKGIAIVLALASPPFEYSITVRECTDAFPSESIFSSYTSIDIERDLYRLKVSESEVMTEYYDEEETERLKGMLADWKNEFREKFHQKLVP